MAYSITDRNNTKTKPVYLGFILYTVLWSHHKAAVHITGRNPPECNVNATPSSFTRVFCVMERLNLPSAVYKLQRGARGKLEAESGSLMALPQDISVHIRSPEKSAAEVDPRLPRTPL